MPLSFIKITFLLLCLAGFQPILTGQVVNSLFHADHVGYRLPGTVPEERFVLSLPAYGMGIYNSGFSYNDLVKSTTNNVYEFDVPGVLNKLKAENTLAIGGSLQTIGVGWKMNNLWFEVGHQIRFENFLFYPKDLFGVFFQGNAPYIGQTANMGLRVQSFNYSELYAGVALKMETFSFGARVKLLNGAVAAQSERHQLDLYTSDDIYQITLNSDYLLYTSPELEILKGEENDLQIGMGDYSFNQLFSRNVGFGLDLGASVMLGEKIRLDAAIMDLGSIQWKDDVIGYESKKTIQYDGFEFNSLFADDSLSLVGAIDTLEELLAFEEVEGKAFTTTLPWYFQVGGRYMFTDWFNMSGMYFGQQRSGKLYSGMSFGANVSLGRIFETGLTYSIYDRTFDNIGLHALLRLGPVRIYAASDNVLSLLTINDSRYANGRAGLQVAF